MSLIHSTRVLLIRVAKILPFVVCFILFLSYAEDLFALCINDFVVWGEYVILNKPISWTIIDVFEYNWNTVIILAILSISVETCVYNKLACLYLGVNLIEKSYFDFELEPWIIIVICIINILISLFFVYKGISILCRK